MGKVGGTYATMFSKIGNAAVDPKAAIGAVGEAYVDTFKTIGGAYKDMFKGLGKASKEIFKNPFKKD